MPDSSDYYFQGKKLTANGVKRLERKLKKNPDDMTIRCKLLGYYGNKKYYDEDSKTAFTEQVLWIVEHQPEHEIASSTHIGLHRSTHGDAYNKARQLWLNHLVVTDKNLTLIANAAQFLVHDDIELSQKLYGTAQELQPSNPYWPSRLSHLYELERMFSEALFQKEKAYELAPPEERWYYFKDLPTLALSANEFSKAEVHAKQLLEMAKEFQDSRWHGAFLHSAHIVLASIHFSNRDMNKTREHLRQSYSRSTRDSRPLWWMARETIALLQNMLDSHEPEGVVEFLENCIRTGDNELCIDRWISEIRRGIIPDLDDKLPYRTSENLSEYLSSEDFWSSLTIYRKAPTAKDTTIPIQRIPLWKAILAHVEDTKPSGWGDVASTLRAVPLKAQRDFARQYYIYEQLQDCNTGACMVHRDYQVDTESRRLICMFHKNVQLEQLDAIIHDAALVLSREENRKNSPTPESHLVVAIDLAGDNNVCRLFHSSELQ